MASGSFISVTLSTMHGKSYNIVLSSQFTLAEFRQKVQDSLGPDMCDSCRLIYHGKVLDIQNETRFESMKDNIRNNSIIYIFQRMTGGCFLSNTIVFLSDRTKKRIDEIQIGDRLLSFTTSGDIVTTSVEQVFIHEVGEYIELQAGENLLHVTQEHPFFIGNGHFSSLDKLNINDNIFQLIDDKLQPISIRSMKTIFGSGTRVYNLRTVEPHTYFANGVAVHNKFGADFVDLSNTAGLKRLEWTETAPEWRMARPGLCLEGQCTTPSCKAYQKQVVVNLEYGQFDLLVDSGDRSKCPMCKNYVNPKTCAFNNCKWRWWGIKQIADGTKPEKFPCQDLWTDADNAYHRFDQDVSGTVRWLQLIIETKPRQDS